MKTSLRAARETQTSRTPVCPNTNLTLPTRWLPKVISETTVQTNKLTSRVSHIQRGYTIKVKIKMVHKNKKIDSSRIVRFLDRYDKRL